MDRVPDTSSDKGVDSSSLESLVDTRNETINKLQAKEKSPTFAIILVNVLELTLYSLASYYLTRWITNRFQKRNNESNRLKKYIKNRLWNLVLGKDKREKKEECRNYNGTDLFKYSWKENQTYHRRLEHLDDLNDYEAIICQDVIDPRDMTSSLADIGGIDDIKVELWDLMIFPLLRPELFQSESGLVTPPRGILLYGPPGTGKTLLAKAIAHDSQAIFINMKLSHIMDKFYGESNKLVAATFSLAKKLAPAIIFIDEIDTFLGSRGNDGFCDVSRNMKSEFLTLWDGITTESQQDNLSPPVMLLCATNRPYDVDEAILRRLPRTFEISLPDKHSRIQILQLILKKQSMTNTARESIHTIIADVTEGYSGSDLKELCRAAAMEPIRELTKDAARKAVMGVTITTRNKRKVAVQGNILASRETEVIRPVNEHDLLIALKKVKKSGQTAYAFQKEEYLNSKEILFKHMFEKGNTDNAKL